MAKKHGKSSMGIGMVLLLGCRCRCGHEWLARDKDEKPRVCPRCKSPNWDRPKVNARRLLEKRVEDRLAKSSLEEDSGK